jgi:hypothetical protein
MPSLRPVETERWIPRRQRRRCQARAALMLPRGTCLLPRDAAQPAASPITAHQRSGHDPATFLFDSNRRTLGRPACLAMVAEADESGDDAGGGGGAEAGAHPRSRAPADLAVQPAAGRRPRTGCLRAEQPGREDPRDPPGNALPHLHRPHPPASRLPNRRASRICTIPTGGCDP